MMTIMRGRKVKVIYQSIRANSLIKILQWPVLCKMKNLLVINQEQGLTQMMKKIMGIVSHQYQRIHRIRKELVRSQMLMNTNAPTAFAKATPKKSNSLLAAQRIRKLKLGIVNLQLTNNEPSKTSNESENDVKEKKSMTRIQGSGHRGIIGMGRGIWNSKTIRIMLMKKGNPS